jgi:cobalamin biosynthesis Mg chelatase CobN
MLRLPPSSSVRPSLFGAVRRLTPMTFIVFVILAVLAVLVLLGVAYIIARRWL